MRPDFLIIGAEKAGTTWLHDVLRVHPDLFLPDVKELHFFNLRDSNGGINETYDALGLPWYERQFERAPPGALIGEATPLYLCDGSAPSRIRRTLPGARFIVILRDPVERSWSHYRMARAKRHLGEPLDSLIARHDRVIVTRSLYAAQLDRWRALFPADRFLVLFFEEVMAAPRAALTRIADWLGVASAPLMRADPDMRRNPATGYRSPALHNASVAGARHLRRFPPTRDLARRMKAAGIYDLVKRINRAAPPDLDLTQAQRAALRAVFADDVRRLETVHGLRPPWPAFFADATPQPLGSEGARDRAGVP